MKVTASMPERISDLVAPLAHEATDMRATDTAGLRPGRSGAVAARSDPLGDVNRATSSPTPATTTTRGARTSTTATRTTTTRTTRTTLAPSADPNPCSPAGLSFEALVQAYFDCRRHKRNTSSAIAFEADLERNLCTLHGELAAGAWHPGRSICFVIKRPKPREVWAAGFRDRVVHHLLYNHIAFRFERAFIADSCACIKGRGTLYAARRLEAKARSITQTWTRPAHYLKCDLANFFVRIDKRILRGQLAGKIREAWWLDLAERVLLHDPRTDVDVRGTAAELALIPPHKSLFNQPSHRGLPIGNLSSQFFANVYLDALDQYVKHQLRVRHYIRYVDDFILLHQSPQQLNAWRADIEAFLPRELGANLNPSKTILQPIARGIDFVGHVIEPHRRTIRRRTFNDALHRLEDLPREDLHASANSYLGLMRQASRSHRDRTRIANLVRRRGFAVDHRLTKAYA